MNREIIVGGIYRHFKGLTVKVIAIAKQTETGEALVIYSHCDDKDYKCKNEIFGVYKNGVYARPLSMFLSKVDKVKYPDVKQEHRFELLR